MKLSKAFYCGFKPQPNLIAVILFCGILSLLSACSISYGFEGGSIDYDKTKTIQINSFPNRTSFYPEMTQIFDQALRKRFIEQTRLREVTSSPDIQMSGEITGYTLSPMAVKSDAYASQTRLTITIKVDYVNNKETGKDVTQSFSSFLEFDSNESLSSVEDRLVKDIIDDIIDQIYNSTVANW
jgi:hypothetical protein